MENPGAILIAGPTASGKSKFALEMATRWGGEIVNTDSMQIYSVLNILTARPDGADLEKVPHHLYGYVDVNEAFSVSLWLEDATQKANQLWDKGVVPIFVGGTGLYFQALEEGLAQTPEIPMDVRAQIRTALDVEGSEALHLRLKKLDSLDADALQPTDGHRIARALEVITATGKPLSYYQSLPVANPLLGDKKCKRYVLMPERSLLHSRINKRTDDMLEEGAVDEVRSLLALNLRQDSTVLRAIGVKQITDYIHGKQTLNECAEKVKAATRQYSKRQSTWFRGQFSDEWEFVAPDYT